MNGEATILPTYVAREVIEVGGLKMELLVKEITHEAEAAAYRTLASYHYRNQPLFGRTVRLIAQSVHATYPKTIGYIELATPFYMNKPRARILDAPFQSGEHGWENWDRQTASSWINAVVRIARCVIYPEFRGVGLGQLLVKHARIFARDRWQAGGVKPYFIEISADMLKFVPFAERGGMHFIGETEGNLNRVVTDLAYLLKNRRRVKAREIVREEAFGIVDQQVARMNRAAALIRKQGWTKGEFLEQLSRMGRTPSLRMLEVFREIVSHPKPTYMAGLNADAERFLRKRIASVGPKNGFESREFGIDPALGTLSVKNLNIEYSSRVATSRHTSAIRHAFGISPGTIRHHVIKDLTFALTPGQIALVIGPSGSGKTTLLRFLEDPGAFATGNGCRIRVPENYQAGTFTPTRSQRPLIDGFRQTDVRSAMQLLGHVGLSDAFVYLKRFDELSAGQQYRAMLAQLLSRRFNVWIADEFCTNLDPVAASCVAHRIAALCRSLRAILIVATPQPDLIARSLSPDIVIRLTTAWENEVFSGEEFLARLPKPNGIFHFDTIRTAASTLHRIRTNGQGALITFENRRVTKGPLLLKAGTDVEAVFVEDFRSRAVDELSIREIKGAGFSSRRALLCAARAALGRRRGSVGQVGLIRLGPTCHA